MINIMNTYSLNKLFTLLTTIDIFIIIIAIELGFIIFQQIKKNKKK